MKKQIMFSIIALLLFAGIVNAQVTHVAQPAVHPAPVPLSTDDLSKCRQWGCVITKSVSIGETPSEFATRSYHAAVKKKNSLDFRHTSMKIVEKKDGRGWLYFDVI